MRINLPSLTETMWRRGAAEQVQAIGRKLPTGDYELTAEQAEAFARRFAKARAAFRVKGGCPTCKPIPAPVRVTLPAGH